MIRFSELLFYYVENVLQFWHDKKFGAILLHSKKEKKNNPLSWISMDYFLV